jgi:galactonate dehydratase
MNIRSIEPFHVHGTTILKVTTDEGIIGWGESIEPYNEAFLRTLIGAPAHRYAVYQHAGLNMALLDIMGKAAKAPAYQILGGPTRNKVRVMTRWSDKAVAAGYRAFITPPPLNPKDGLDFVVDGGGALTPGQASSLAAQLERHHPLWLDEPCPLLNLGALRKVSDESVTPIGWGRTITQLSQVQDLLREQLIDVVRLNIGRHGISAIRKAAALAETYYVAVAPTHHGGPIATAAAFQLAASIPNFFIQEIPWTEGDDRKRRSELVGADIEKAIDGFAALPKGPGLGIDVNEAALRRMAA